MTPTKARSLASPGGALTVLRGRPRGVCEADWCLERGTARLLYGHTRPDRGRGKPPTSLLCVDHAEAQIQQCEDEGREIIHRWSGM